MTDYNSSNSNSINNNNNINYNSNNIFINKIWNNIYIQNNIKYHLRLYNSYRYSQYIHLDEHSLDTIKNHQHLEYIRSLVIYDIKKQNYQELLKVLHYLKPFEQIESITIFQEDLLNCQLKELLDEFEFIDGIVFQETTVPLASGILTSRVKNVIFEFNDFNQQLSYQHPSSPSSVISIFPSNGLLKLTLGIGFNSILEPGTLPATLKHLTFNLDYNIALLKDSLPLGLESIIFGSSFNQPIDHLHQLNQLLDLSLGSDFNQNIQGILPKSLKRLSINGNFSEPQHKEDCDDKLVFPNSIESLELYSYIGDHYIFKLPTSLKNLVISNNYFKNNTIDFINHNKNLIKISITSNNPLMYNNNNNNNNNQSQIQQQENHNNNNNNESLQQRQNNRLNNYQFNFFKLNNNYNSLKQIEFNSTLSSLFQDNKNLVLDSLKEDIEIQSRVERLKILIIRSGNLDFSNSKIKFRFIEKLKINLFGQDIHLENAILPINLRSIILCSKYGFFSLGDGILLNCSHLTSIHLKCYGKPIKKSMFPPSLLNLELVDYKKQLGQDSLPTTLTSLKLLSRYSLNSTLLPINLRILYINQLPKIENHKQWLPSQLVYLLINEKYKTNSLSNIKHSNLPVSSLKAIYISNSNYDLLNNNTIYNFLIENLNIITISNKLNSIYKNLIK